ncbi:MAG: tripartite tricarboxylate transporter substrate binding protein [Candidimonas sp.]|nr:MAG: tripartite tricarboxylate transporter substrate binding protein [Candidimonas sp.]TAM22763.1 MAG: tripartite tricarboxylate transporter substrate binding protein [Candidimonas sp.]
MKLFLTVLFSLAVLGITPSAMARYPDHPMRLVVPFPPGGNIDTTARILSKGLDEILGKQVLVENRPGAGGMIGSAYVAHAPADGYTFLLASTGALATAKALLSDLPFDPVKDFESAATISRVPFVLVVNKQLPVKNLRQFIAYAKEHPSKVAMGTDGLSTANHLTGELFQAMSGTKLLLVPYKGSSQALTDLMGGQIQSRFDQLSSALPLIRSGKLRALGVTTLVRSQVVPELPTLAESGLPGFEASTTTGILFPVGTPRAIIEKINAAVNKVLEQPNTVTRFKSMGADVEKGSPPHFQQIMRSEVAKWTKVVHEAHIKAQ